VSALCRAAQLSRQGYYQKRTARQRAVGDEEAIIVAVRRERAQQPRLGVRRLHYRLSLAGIHVGRDTLFNLLRGRKMLVPRKRRKVRTTHFDQTLPVYRNRLYTFAPSKPHEVWVADITYIRVAEGFVFLCLLTDLFSRRIVGWHVGESLSASEALKALHRACQDLPPGAAPIHHSDRGCQYCCHEYVAALNRHGLPISMTEQNHCYENCYAERVNGILKDEFNLDATFRSLAHARQAIAQAIATYNQIRPHTSLGMRSPNEVHRAAA